MPITDTGTAEEIISLTVNPGLVNSFPWLSGIANSFDRYRVLELKYKYLPLTSASTSGTFTICFDPNVQDIAPISRTDMMAMQVSQRTNVWNPSTMNVPRGTLLDRGLLYTRSGDSVQSDLKTYDLGVIHWSIASNTGSFAYLGDLFVEYTVELINPQRDTSFQTLKLYGSSLSTYIDLAYLEGPGFVTAATLVTTALTFKTLITGTYFMLLSTDQTGETITPYAIGLAKNVSLISTWDDGVNNTAYLLKFTSPSDSNNQPYSGLGLTKSATWVGNEVKVYVWKD